MNHPRLRKALLLLFTTVVLHTVITVEGAEGSGGQNTNVVAYNGIGNSDSSDGGINADVNGKYNLGSGNGNYNKGGHGSGNYNTGHGNGNRNQGGYNGNGNGNGDHVQVDLSAGVKSEQRQVEPVKDLPAAQPSESAAESTPKTEASTATENQNSSNNRPGYDWKQYIPSPYRPENLPSTIEQKLHKNRHPSKPTASGQNNELNSTALYAVLTNLRSHQSRPETNRRHNIPKPYHQEKVGLNRKQKGHSSEAPAASVLTGQQAETRSLIREPVSQQKSPLGESAAEITTESTSNQQTLDESVATPNSAPEDSATEITPISAESITTLAGPADEHKSKTTTESAEQTAGITSVLDVLVATTKLVANDSTAEISSIPTESTTISSTGSTNDHLSAAESTPAGK